MSSNESVESRKDMAETQGEEVGSLDAITASADIEAAAT